MHLQEIQRKVEAQKQLESEFIPVGGSVITCQMHVQDPANPQKTKQVRLPYQALQWLITTLEKQGMNQDTIEGMNEGNLSSLVNSYMEQQAAPQPPQFTPPGDPGFY